ncbi:superoxide dismutase family protein [Saccharothrix deserti]|uniref:superoxide dismutase family protein n=1 Tax=Saccharothrix deserti TaxID=2593674 RepID=UPI00131EB12A|nr:superoxide dismutase family protein [Saccharothrix deserti]
MRIVIVMAALCAAAGCGSSDPGPAQPAQTQPAQTTTSEPAASTRHTGTLAPVEAADTAFTYNPAVAPPGAELELEVVEADSMTTVRLSVDRLLPDRGYAIHAHTQPCGRVGTDAGPHYQHEIDPAATPDKPSVDPAYANPQNEIWLDLTTDGQGSGSTEATVPFVFGDRVPASIVVHEQQKTATEHGKAGTAGARLACFTAPFR